MKNCLKWTASGLLLALMFVLVFAGTLSGAFGIKNELQQNGIIENNVASAANTAGSNITIGLSNPTITSWNINPDVSKKGYVCDDGSYLIDDTSDLTWTTGNGSTGGRWMMGDSSNHHYQRYSTVWFDFDLGNDYSKFSDSISINVAGTLSATTNPAYVAITSSSSEFSDFDGNKGAEALYNEVVALPNKSAGVGHDGSGTSNVSLTENVSGRYVRIYFTCKGRYQWIGSQKYGIATFANVKVTLTRELKSYNVSYNKNGINSSTTVANTSHKYMAASNITSDFYVGNGQYFTGWNTSANGSGIAMAIGASTGTSTAASDFGNVVKTNLQNGQTTTTLYAQYQGISFSFNGTDYTQYNNEVLQVLQGRGGYLTYTVDSSYSTVISYRNSNGSEIAQPTTVGVYSAIIEVLKDGKTRGTVTLPFEIIEGDFSKIPGASGKWGSVTNPYVIHNATQLRNLAGIVNGTQAPLNCVVGSDNGAVTSDSVVATSINGVITFANCYFVISADLGADTAIELVPIGKDSTYYFAGTIFGGNDSDANNRTMRTINLNIQQSGVSNVGLFGYVKGASISYIKTAGTIVGGNATGGLVGCMENGEIFNCANSATVTGRERVGGIVGYNPDNQRGKIYGTIINDGAINGTNMVGGLVGQWHGEWNLNGTYGTFTNTGDVNGGTGASVGGIAGFADRTIKNAANSGNVVGGTSVGGIAGRCQAPIENSYNTGDVRGTATTSQGEITGSPTGVFVGGITGYTSANASISNCYNTGHISALSTSGGYLSNANYVGGIVGFAQAAVSYCANIGGLIEGNDYLGGIVGNSSSTIDHCYDVQGQRKHRYDTGRIGAISGYGGTATNSWAINAKANDGSTCSNPNPTISNVGKVFVSVGDVAPAVIDGYTEKVWTDILTININGFKAIATVNNGKFLASATASNGATSVVPAKIDGALTANANGASAQQTTDATLTYWYNANTSSNIYVQIKDVGGVANSKTYNGANQTIDNVSASPFTATAFYFDANYAGTATDGKMNAGTYSVIVDVVVDGNVVGRKLFGSWTINTRIISQNSSSATYYYGARILSPDIADILSNIVNGHSVTSDKTLYNFYDAIPASGSRTYTITYTNIRIVANGSDVTGNYKINNSYTFAITVNEGDFGVYGTTDIEKNPWGSVNNPYVIRTQAQLERLSVIVASGSAVNSIYNSTNYPYVQATDKSFANAYFVLDGNISMTYTSSFSYSNISSSPAGNSGETADKLFDNNTSSSKLCVSNNAKTVTIYVSTNVPIIVNNYSWWTGNDTSGNTGRNPNYFKIEGSTDGSNWYVIDERSNGSWPTTNNTQVNVTGMNGAGRAGRYNRFRITSTCSGGTWQASEFKFNNATSEQSVPIGNSSTKFSGTFDGKNHTISNFKTSGQYSGLFGYVNGATIQNLTVNVTNNAGATSAGGLVGAVNGTTTIRNCTVNGTISGTHQVGGFVGFAQGVYQDNTLVLPCNLTIEGCINNATVTTTSQASDNNRTSAGGFVGYVNAGATVTITSYTDENGQTKKSTNNGKISTTSSADNKGVGGFVGYSYGKITLTDCVNEKNATITGKERVGGLVGYIGKADSDSQKEMVISGCENKAAVTSNSTNDVYGIGGIVGYNSGHKVAITNCINSGAITGTHETAGIIGYSDHSDISGCTNSGAVSGFATVGGIVGKMGGGSIVSCKNTATVKASKARDIDGDGNLDGAYLGGIAGWIAGNVNNCYNSGTVTTETSWGNSNIVGGIVGFLVNGKTVSYCYNSGTIVGSSQIGGIIGYLPGALTTVTYCYHSGRINSVWNENNVAKGSLGYITGNDTSVLDSCWILPGASTDSASSTKIKTNGRKLEVGQYRYVPAIIDDYSTYGWTDILTKNINGFRVQESVNPGASQFFESKKGSNSTTHLTPNKTESSNQANALIRDNTDSFTITAWYDANTASDIYCAVNTIAIDISADTYNNAQLGFTRSDVTTPGTSGSVYGIVFDYKGKNHNEIFVCAFDSNGNIVAGSTNPTQVDTYNTTVFVKIGDIVVGKKIAVDYTIDKAALNVGWTWTDKLHANLYDRTGNGDKVQFVYNGKAQGLDSVSEHLRDVQLFDVTGNDLTNTNAATYTRTYTLKDTRNYKLQNANNNNADLSGTTVTFEWKIRKNKLTVSNYWTGADLNPSGEFYTFEYNATHQGLKLQDGITFYVEPDTRGNQHVIDTIAYEIAQGVECVAADTYTRTFTIKDTTNYEVGNRLSYNTSVLPNQKGSDVNTEKSVVTYTWKIVPYSLATNITSGNVWFGGRTDLIVGNQGIANVNVGNPNTNISFYPLQSKETGVQKVLVYAQHNYAADKFVLYVKYNNGTVAVLTQGTEYTVGTLDTNNTFGTFVNVVSQADPVVDTNVTASGTGNFSGNITKYYTAMFSDFGWKKDKSPSDEDWGSQDNPYVISTPEHLLRLSQIVNGGMAWNSIQNTVTAGVCIAPQTTAKATSRDYKDAYFLVTVDIDMSGYISTDGVYNFLPIGTRSTQNQTELPFSATFDGGDNTITYVYNVGSFYNVDGARTNYVGLFGYLNGATISNLKVASNGGLSITDNRGIVGIEYVGGIAGCAVDSTLYNSVLAYGGWVRGENYVGGIVGYGERITIESSEAVSSANVGGETYVGGIVGKWIVSNQNQIGGSVAGQRYVTPADQTDVMGIKYVGGIAGWMDTSSCATTISYAPQLNNNGKEQNLIVVGGIEYVGALFGAFIGNGYHQNATNDKYTAIVIDKDASDKFKVGNVKVLLQKLNEKSASGNAKVVGGLVGYAEGVGILFNTDWTTSNVTLDTGNYTPSFIGGIAGVLGKNATIEAIYQLKNDGTFLTGGTHTITHSVPDEQKTFGTAAKPLGSFVGGIVGYVSSQAGVYWETGTTIFGNGISLVNSVTIYATSYAGGIFGALGDLSTSVAQTFENDTNSILYNVLTTGVRSGNASTTLGLAPTVDSNGITAKGRLVNNASISVSGSYVGGIAGYGGAKVRFVLRNTPQDSAIDVSKLNIYSGGSDIFINGSYAGGIAGYLVDNLEHDLQYIVVKARFNTNNQSATRVGGLVGYMGSGNVQNCVVTNGGSSAITASTDTYQGSEYVGGLVGETQNATIRNSVSTGFNLEKTSNTKGGLLGYGANPTIDSSWTFYIAKKRTNFAKNATPNGAYYATVSQSPYGKYILVDEGLINATEASYPTFVSLCGFVGLLTNANVEGTLEFAVKVPNKTLNSNYENTQLAFYNASGSDTVTDNVDSFSKFENNNNTLTIALDMASGNSMQICVVGIEFVNVPQKNDTDTDKTTVVEGTYRKPSNSDKYIVHVTTANFNSERQITKIVATVYFECNDNLSVVIGTTYDEKRVVGDYNESFTPGSSTNPYTISSQKEWNDFAYSVYSGANNYSGKYVKLLTDRIVINTGTGGMHEGTKGSHNFGSVQAIPSAGQNAPLTDANGNAVDRNNIGYNFAGDISHDGNVNNFHGTFDGNGHYITINYVSGGYYRVSAFPNAADATFRNLTIKGKIQAASQMTGANGIANSAAYDVAGFVGKPFGSLKFYNCTNEADIIGLRNVAGLVGYNSGGQSITFEACVNIGDITSLQGTYTISGKTDKHNWFDSIDSAYGTSNIGFNSGTGGIIGAYTGNITIESCRNAGAIIGGHNVGGIIGLHDGTASAKATLTIQNCANTGNVTSNSGYWGEDEGGVEGAASEGIRQNIFGYVGGLVGVTGQYSILKMYASYNTGDILTLSNIIGGLVGSVGVLYQPKKFGRYDNNVKTGGRSLIAYCYNIGNITAGGTFPKITEAWDIGRENYGGTISGGFVGLAGDLQISQGYNTGNITNYGHISYKFSWQVRAGGFIGQSEPVSESGYTGYVLFDNLYNVGTIYVKPIDYAIVTGHTVKNNLRYGAAISGYCDVSGRSNRIKSSDCYSINNCVSSLCAVQNGTDYAYYKNKQNSWNPEVRDQWYQNEGVAGIGKTQVELLETGRVYNTYDALTAAMDENSKLRMTGSNFAFDQSITALTLNYGSVGNYTSIKEQIIGADASISDNAVANLSSIGWKELPDSWLYVYGCLPQLSMFALDTQNGLSMRSVGYGQDDYGVYNDEGVAAGSEQYPYIIKDGVDLMGMQALVDAGLSFEGKYIEIANGSNNLEGIASTRIELATYDGTNTAAVNGANNTMYKAVDQNGDYKVGKSYHLLLQGAIFNKAYNQGQNPTYVGTDYAYWAWNTYYYNGETLSNVWESGSPNPNKWDAYGSMRHYGVFSLQNFIPMGRGNSVFKGNFSGKQANGEMTYIDNVRISTGKYNNSSNDTCGSEYGGLFSKVENAYIGYIAIGGNSKILSFAKENEVSATGGIVGLSLGSSVIDNCGVSGSTTIGAYGVSKTNQYVQNESIANDKKYAKDTYAGGIAGVADPIQGNSYNAGITLTIRNCSVSTSGIIESAKSNIGGVLGYVGGDAGASGKSNTVRIEGCSVDKAVIQAASSANTSSQIGGILGYGSQYVAAVITGCKVGVGGAVSIKGEHSLGGIAGGMSNAKGGYIDSCTVGANTTIERIDVGGDKTVLESPKHGTAIGGLVGFTQDSKDDTSPLTTTFSGTSAFNGTITVSVEATNKSQDSDAKISCIGGIVGDMGSGANFASGSNVTVGGNINITLAAANVGGVVGRTNKATFIGKFNVAPNMSTENAENVGGFIGKNIGTVYILADTTDKLENTTVGALNGTEITIGGKIKGTSEVGGFIGVNNSGSTLNIGSNVANAKPYKSGTLTITITASVTGSGDNVGGIVGKNEGDDENTQDNDYATIDIVKGTIKQNGAIIGANNVGGIIGLNDGLLTTGGGEADTTIGGVTLSEEQQNKIKNLSINNTGSVTGTGDYVGGVVGKLDSPSALRTEDSGKGAIAGTFTNSGNVSGGKFVGGSLGYVGKNVTITAKNNVATLFVNDGQVTATGYYAGGSIGVLVGKIEGVDNGHTVNFKNTGTVTATGFVGGSIGVLAGPVKYAQFVNSSGNLSIAAVNAVGGSVGFIGVPTPLETILTGVGITLADDYVKVENTHFEASGELTANPDSNAISIAKDAATNKSTGWGGVGGAIGVIGKNVRWGTEKNKNTYYANGNVTANGINNVGGIVGIILTENVNISNMLAYNTTVKGGENVGGIVGATDGIGTVITSAYAIEGTFTGSKNVGGIIGLAKTDTDASTSYWVKGYANSDIATYDVKDLSKLGFTTGKATTGWFFLYANDADGANGLGTINTSHSTNSDLQYWKRIADAYTASEREKGLDKTDLKSNIVYGGGSPQLSTLYATATAAEVNSQYYMYTATSNEAVKPQVEFDDTRNGYFISVKTNDQDAAGNKRQAQNVAVFYRKITKGSDLTYNGYARNAVVGMDGVGLLEQTPDETTVYDETYRNKYFYTTSTSVDGTTATTAMSDPNTYKSTIKIYFFDGKGKARIVGGIDDLEWTIKARELSATFKVATNRKYGEDSNGSEGENKYDMFVSISNIAPNRGKQVPIKLDVSVGNDIVVTFTWDGTVFKPSKAGSGITLSSIGMIPSEAMKDSDTMFIAEEQTDGLNTQVLNCYLVFTEAKAYTVTINTSDVVAKPRYTIKNEEATGNFTVSPAELRLERTSGGSHAFDNTSTHGAVWKITGFVYEDGFKQLAQFNPVFHSNGQTENMYDSGGLKNNINFTNGSVVQATQTDGVNKTITITLSTVRTLGDYYIEFNAGKVGENKYRVGNYELSFVKGQNEYHIVKTTISISSNLTSANNKKVYNQKTSVITVTFTASAAGDPSFSGIFNFEEFLTRFFAVKDTAKFSKVDIPTSSNDVKKTVTWTFTTEADADKYVVALIEGKDHVAEEANCAHDPDKLPSYTYTIKQRPVTISVTQTAQIGSGGYTYNTKHQGLDTVSVNQGSQGNEIGLLADDSIDIRISGSVSKTLTFKNKYSQSANIFTADANTYQVSFALSGNTNYKLHDSSIKTLSWTIEQYVVKVGAFSLGSGKTYDGTAVTPTITIVGISGSNGTYTYENDTFTLTYSIEKDGGSAYESGKLVNAGTYKIKVGGTNGKIVARRAKGTSTGSDTSNNYKFDSSNSTADYTINACPIAIEWDYPTLVYTGNNQNITIKSITVNGTAIAMTSNSVKSGLGNDVLTFTLSGGGVNAGSYTTKAELSSVSGTNEGVDSVVGNYTPKLFTSDPFTIVKSKVGIRYNGGTANKVYDANENVKDNNFTFAVYSTNFGASGNDDLFSIKMLYDNKNVSNGYTKTINFAYTFKATNTNYELDASTATSQAVPNVGQITPAHIRVALDKLRSGKATRTYTDDEFYGGADGATGNGRSKTYRTGEGFTVSGVLGSDNINVVARYQEADNTRNSNSGNYFDFSKYVNDVYKDANGTFKKASAGTYFKKLVFTMTGTDAANYTFNVYDSSAEGGNKYSESDSTAAAIQSVTVYDSRDSKNNKNASGAASIQIEITVKSVRVEYSDTAQSYANDDNTYNTDWKPITGTNKDMDKADAKIKVSNGWMYADGKDHTAEEGYTKREYRGYTTIRGSQNSERLGAKVDPTNGMDLNYRLSNQPTLTIAYFVSTGDEYEINSLARLLIASFYYTASQNPGNLEIIKIVSSGYKWVSVVSADDYDKGEFKLPQDTPITDSKATTWDEYFTELEAKGYSVFLNIEANAQDNIPANTWGYYATTTSESSTIPTSYKLTKDIVGKFTESDISILNTFFTVIGDDGKTTTSTWSGNGTYLKNVLKAAEGKIATINGSLFVSTAKAEGATAITGFDGTFDGNGYVIEYLNIMGYGKDNVGLFDIIGANGIVKNLHLRNVTINGNAKYVGGIAGKVLAAADALTEKSVNNVSFHGSINVTGSTDQSVGGLFGISERAVENAIVLGSITVSNANAKVGGVVGSSEQGMSNVVSLMQIDANCNVGAFSQTNTNVTNSYHLQNAVWRRNGSSITFVNHDNAKTYDEFMLGSNSLYSNGTSESGTYDVIKETFADSGQNANPRQSKRLRDMVSVYLLMYSLSVNNGKYTISSSSWLVGTADGTTAKPIAIANKQNVSLLRELRFASFTLKANVSIEIASTFSGAFYGSVNAGAYKITCDKAMFEAYANDASAWLSVQ